MAGQVSMCRFLAGSADVRMLKVLLKLLAVIRFLIGAVASEGKEGMGVNRFNYFRDYLPKPVF